MSDFFLGKTGTLVTLVKFDGVPFSGATVTGDYYKPDDTVYLSSQPFTEIGTTGVYSHTFDIALSDAPGVYKAKIKAVKSVGGSGFTDDFEDQNDTGWVTTGATWVVVDDGPPQNFIYKKVDYGGFIYATKADETNMLNGTYTAKVRLDSPGGSYVGIAFRYSDPNNTYDFYFRRAAGNVRLRRNAATLQETPSGSLTINFDTWYTLKVILNDDSIKCYVDDVLQIDVTDVSPLPAGKVGFFAYNSIASYDDVNVTISGVTEEVYAARSFSVGSIQGVAKNVALPNFMFEGADTGLSYLGFVQVDNGAEVSMSDTPVSIGNKKYRVNIASSELNGRVCTFQYRNGNEANDVTVTIITAA